MPHPVRPHPPIALWPYSSWPIVWPWLNSGSIPSWPSSLPPHPRLHAKAAELAQQLNLAHMPPHAHAALLAGSAQRHLAELLQGIARYRQAPAYRPPLPAKIIHRAGHTVVRDYGARTGDGIPLLVIPSLINRYHILDLSRDCSLLRFLRQQGFRVLLVDWQTPEAEEWDFSLTSYATRILAIYAWIQKNIAPRTAVMGYCLGGMLALALAQRADISALALLATPWDLHRPDLNLSKGCASWLKLWRSDLTNGQPLQNWQQTAMFASWQPLLAGHKFRRSLHMGEKTYAHFVRVEDWLNAGPALPAPAALQLLQDFYGDNHPARGLWMVDGAAVDPRRISCPTLMVIPQDDVIVPPPSAFSLQPLLKDVTVHQPPLGHVGMIVSSRARAHVWETLSNFFRTHLF